MSKTYAKLRLHGEDRNAEKLGAYIAWLIANDLMSDYQIKVCGADIAMVRMQAMTGPAFLTTVLDGEFKQSQLNDVGQSFSEHYFMTDKYTEDYDSCQYEGDDEWHRFDELSPKISAAFRLWKQPATKKGLAKIIQFPFGKKR